MSVDKGGLDYRIKTDYDSTGVEVFKLDIKQLREEIAGLKKDLVFKPLTVQVDKRGTSDAVKQSSAALQKQREELTLTEKALRNYIAALEKRRVKQEEANVAESAAFELERITASSLEGRRTAEAALTKLLDKRKQAQEVQNAAAARGVTLSEEEQRAVGLLTKSQEKLLAAKKKLQALQDDAGNTELRRIKALTTAQGELNKRQADQEARLQRMRAGLVDPFAAPATLEDKAAAIKLRGSDRENIRQILAAQGLGLDGKPLPKPTTPQDVADKIKLNAQQKENIRQILAAQGLGLDGKPLPKPATPQDIAKQIALKADQKDAITKLLFAQGRDASGKPLPPKPKDPTLTDQIKGFFGISTEADKAERAGSRALFTFRRLVGIFAVFTLARATIRGFFGLVDDAIKFNSTIEQSTLGIAALLTAVGSVESATGKAVSKAESFALAQAEARRQTQLLRQEAVAASIDFNQALQAFQNGIAPGLRAGLNVDQVRKFSVQIAQAGKALGLADNQLAEEIRSILQGTIQARTTRIAVALGITNEDIRRAKELGTLADLLNRKFIAFNTLAEELGNSFEGAFTRVRTAAELAIQKGSVGFFEELKGLLSDVLKLLSGSADALDKFQPSPAAVTVFEAIFGALKNVVAQFRELVSTAGLNGIIALAQAIAGVINLVGSSLLGALQGVIFVVKALLAAFKAVAVVVRSLASILPFDLPSLNATLQTITKLVVEVTLVLSIFRSMRLAITVIQPAIAAVVLSVRVLGAAIITTRSGIEAARVSAIGLGKSLKSAGIGLAVALGVLALEKSGLLDKIFGNEDINSKKAKVLDLASQIKEAFNLRPQIQVAAESLQKFDEEMKKLQDTVKTLKVETTETLRSETLGVSFFRIDGKVLEEARLRLQGILEVENAIRDKRREATTIEEGIASASQQEVNAREELLRLSKEENVSKEDANAAVLKLQGIYDKLIEKQDRLTQLQSKASLLQDIANSRQAAKDQGLPVENTTLEDALRLREKELTAIRAEIESLEAERLKTLQGFSDLESVQLRLAEISGKIVDAQGRQVALNNTLTTIAEAERQQRQAINETINQKLILLAKEASIQLANQSTVASIQAQSARNELNARLAFANAAVQEKIAAQGALDTLRAQQAIEARRNADTLSALDKLIAVKRQETAQLQKQLVDLQARIDQTGVPDPAAESLLMSQKLSSEEALNGLIEQRIELLKAQTAEDQKAQVALEEAIRKQQILNTKAAEGLNNLGPQFALAIKELAADLPSQYQVIFDTLKDIVSSFASFASNAIVDAFDPSKKLDLKQRFGEFLQGIARQILQTMFQIAATKALLGLSVFFGFNDGGNVPALGRAKGGRVPGRKAVGFAGGGRTPNAPHHGPRPRGLDPRDRVPVWARVGEWFVSPERSRQVGDDFMSRLVHGAIDPGALRAAAGLLGAPAVAPVASAGPGFALGGFVSQALSSKPPAASSGSQAGSAGPSPAYIVANEQVAERLLRGGGQAWVRYMEENGFVRR